MMMVTGHMTMGLSLAAAAEADKNRARKTIEYANQALENIPPHLNAGLPKRIAANASSNELFKIADTLGNTLRELDAKEKAVLNNALTQAREKDPAVDALFKSLQPYLTAPEQLTVGNIAATILAARKSAKASRSGHKNR